MSNSALDEFMKRKPAAAGDANVPATESRNEDLDEIDYPSYGTNRNGRQVLMIDIRTLAGVRLALAYSYLTSIFFDPSGVIVLSFVSHNVRITGRNIEPLYNRLVTYSVRYIQEQNAELERNAPADQTFIASVEISDTSETDEM